MTTENAILHFGEEWANELTPLIFSDLFIWIEHTLYREYTTKKVTPNWTSVFAAFRRVPPSKLKVVILGDRPYKTGHANGLAFSMPNGIQESRVLYDIIRNIEEGAFGSRLSLDFDWTLERWAEQGVLLLNSSLTTTFDKEHNPHIGIWNKFTTYLLKYLTVRHPHVVVLSIGEGACITDEFRTKLNIIQVSQLKLRDYSSNVFGKVNDILVSQNGKDNLIYWDNTQLQIFHSPL